MKSAKTSVMIDLNVLLDVMEKREPWVMDSAKTCAICGAWRVFGYVSPHALTTIYYIVRKRGGKDLAKRAIDWILAMFKVAKLGAAEFRRASLLGFEDFEDAVIAAAAEGEKCAYIVTRNAAHFKASPIPVISPSEFVARFGKK